MAEKKKKMSGFMVYREAAIMLLYMPEADTAAVIKAAARYFLYNDVAELTKEQKEVFDELRDGIDRGRNSYKRKCEAAEKGNNARWHSDS